MTRDYIKTDLTAIYCEALACIEMVHMQMIVKTVLKLPVIQRAANFLAVKREPVSP